MIKATPSREQLSVAGSRTVMAVLGPTNTGKTHLAIERMLGHQTGLIGLPLRLLAREVYDKIVTKIGASDVALITGEERIKPAHPRYYVCTVEAMPREIEVDFLAIDEVQLAADPERGHVFTDRLLHARGQSETLFLGASTIRDTIADLLPGTHFISRPRLSKLTYAGQKKLTRLPRRTAIVAFSANDVYEVAELIRRQRGGAAVVLGALSPRTRNAQVALYQSGEVDFLVATDAIGMGLNLDVDHVAFAGTRKFDGQNHRSLTPAELGQIAGRAGRHMNDGTFGVTANVEPFDSELVNRLETHEFDSVKILQWRNAKLDFSSLDRLKASLSAAPKTPRLTRARVVDDVTTLENASLDEDVRRIASSPAAIRELWDVCQIPDYRKISTINHAELVTALYKFIMSEDGRIPEDWIAEQVDLANRTDGDIDTLANRIAHIRTWTFVSNRHNWLADPIHWQKKTREIEDNLSDALHEQLTKRFVDRRTSVLMKRMRDKEELFAEISDEGAIYVEKHFVGRLHGFRFTPDSKGDGIHGKAARHAAAKVLSKELSMRSRRVSAAKSDAFTFTHLGQIEWRGEVIASLEASDDPLLPQLVLIADEHLSGPDREKVSTRLEAWLNEQIDERIKPLIALAKADDVTGLARGIAFRLVENFGILERGEVGDEIRALDQSARAQLRKYGVRFGAFNIYFPVLLKPAASELLRLLWTLKSKKSLEELPEPPRAGLTSVIAEVGVSKAFYRASGFQLCGNRAVRIDMLERLSDMIRSLVAWRADEKKPDAPPRGATGDGGFTIQPDMMSIMGCSAEELGHILRVLGFQMERRPAQQPDDKTLPEAMNGENREANDNKGEDKKETSQTTQSLSPDSSEDKTNIGLSNDKSTESLDTDSEDDELSIVSQKDGADVEDSVQLDEIWRPRRRKSAQKQARRSTKTRRRETSTAGRRNKKQAEKRTARSAKAPSKKTAKEKPVDPDSPFAALSKLKKDLESQLPDQA